MHVTLRCMANQKSVAASANADDLLFVPCRFWQRVTVGIYLLRKVKFFHFQRWAYGMCVGMVSILAKFAQSYSEYYQVESLVFPALMALFAVGIVYQCIDLLRKEGRTVCE